MSTISSLTKLRPYQDLPLKRGLLPIIFELIIDGGPKYLHRHFDRRHKRLGPIFRHEIFGKKLVSVSDIKLIRKVFRNEGQYPKTIHPEAWLFYNKDRNCQRGLFFRNDESWYKMRQVFNKIFLESSRVDRFGPGITLITSQLFQDWRRRHQDKSDEFILRGLEPDLCLWSIEAIGFLLFGARLGAISKNGSSDFKAQRFTQHVFSMLDISSKFHAFPVELARKFNLKLWRDFCFETDQMMKLANECVSHHMQTLNQQRSTDSLISDVIAIGGLDETDISLSAVDFIIAAADTTSTSINWALYLLAKNPDVQAKIFEELGPFITDDNQLNLKNIDKDVPYLRGFISEVTRLYPAAPFIARILDKPIALAGYEVPPGIPIVAPLITIGRDPNYFDEAHRLKPERWIGSASRRKNYACVPFGMGSRMCIGLKMANLEMTTFIASFVREFEVSLDNKEEIEIKLNMTTWTDKPLSLRLRPRK